MTGTRSSRARTSTPNDPRSRALWLEVVEEAEGVRIRPDPKGAEAPAGALYPTVPA